MSVRNYIQVNNDCWPASASTPRAASSTCPQLTGAAHVLVAGDGPPSMMVPGAGAPSAIWAPLMAELPGFTPHVVDLPGMGDERRALLNRNAQNDGRRLLGPGRRRPRVGAARVHCVVHGRALDHVASTGSTRSGARHRLRRLPGHDVGNVGAAPAPGGLDPTHRAAAEASRPTVVWAGRSVRRDGRRGLLALPELRDLFLAHEQLPDARPALFELIHAVVRLRGPRPQVELTAAQLSRVTQPVQLIWGDQDPFGPPSVGERAAQIMPNAEFHVVPGGHAPWVNQSARVASLAAPFLRDHTAASNSQRTGPRTA